VQWLQVFADLPREVVRPEPFAVQWTGRVADLDQHQFVVAMAAAGLLT
jgi:hypothetical protein